MKKVLILNGPNLNLLHLRNSSIYGNLSLEKIHHQCQNLAKEIGTFRFKNSCIVYNFIQSFFVINSHKIKI